MCPRSSDPNYILSYYTVCPGSSDPFYIVTYMNWVTTSWTHSSILRVQEVLPILCSNLLYQMGNYFLDTQYYESYLPYIYINGSKLL